MKTRKLTSLVRGFQRLFQGDRKGCGRVAVLGGGSWATALAKVIVDKTHHIGWYMRRQENIDQIIATGHNPSYLTQVPFNPDEIYFTSDINKIIREFDTLVFVTPSPYFKQHMEKVTESLKDKFIVAATKGIVPEENMVMSDYFHNHYGIPREQIACLIGPSHAEEVAMNRLTYLTVGCADSTRAENFARKIAGGNLIVDTSTDIQGIEYASVLKNIYAIGGGMCHGLKMGDNFLAVFVANAAAEMTEILSLLSPLEQRDINGSVYLGDLLVTAFSNFSRNKIFGTMIGKGYSIKAAQAEMEMIAEGYYGAKCMKEILDEYEGYEFPIVDAVYNILYEGAQPKRTLRALTSLLK